MTAHGRTKAKKLKRVRMPKHPVEQDKPAMNSRDLVCFLSYSVGCIALNKVTTELQEFWKQDGLPFVVFDQNTYEQSLQQYIWKVIVLHRGATHGWPADKTPQLMAMLQNQKDQGARLVYYIDDFLMHMNNNAPLHLMEMCDTVIAKGYFLPEYLTKSEGLTNVVPLKTWINLEKFDAETPEVEFTHPLNILWFSAGRTGLGFMPSLFEALDPEDWGDTEWHIIGSNAAIYRAKLNKYRGFRKSYSEKVGIDNLYSLVKESDIIINPLHSETDNTSLVQMPAHKVFFNNAKVEIKYILAGAGRKPLLTCRSRCYEECIEHGKNGYMSDDPKEWSDILKKLRSKSLRSRIGNVARKEVEAKYSAEDRWKDIKRYILG
jgi:hypothetical protein